MISEQHLKHLEGVCQTVESGGRLCGVRITPDELRQLCAAARVANAAANHQRCAWDCAMPMGYQGGNHFRHARAAHEFTSALTRYTQPQKENT